MRQRAEAIILAKVRKTISRYRMLDSGDRVIVGVSGGPDSVAMLSILVALKKEFSLYLHIAHLNHMLRGKETDEDALYVEELSEKFALPLSINKRDISLLARAYKLSLQEAGRQARYEFFRSISSKVRANKIAVAQTMNDQAETVLLWILRGCGLKGLTGIPAMRPYPESVSENGLSIIRPLLEISRHEIINYLQDVNLKWRLDSSNKKSTYLRNRVRSELIPLLSNYNPSIELNLSEMAAVLKEDEDYLTSVTDEVFSSLSELRNGSIIIEIAKLRELHIALQRRVLRKAIATLKGNLLRISNEHIEEILRAATVNSPAEICLPHHLIVRVAYGKLTISFKSKELEKKNKYIYSLFVPGEVRINEAKMRVKSSIVSSLTRKLEGFQSSGIAYFDYARMQLPLTIRNRRDGDVFHPLGAKGKKKIKNFFIDRKIPLSERAYAPLLLSGDEIIWVINQQQSEIGKITEETKKVLKIEVEVLP